MAKVEEKTVGEQVGTVAKYVAGSGAVSASIVTLLVYFLDLPAEVATAISVLLMAVVNLVAVWYIKGKE